MAPPRLIDAFPGYRESAQVQTRRGLHAVHWYLAEPALTAFTATIPDDLLLVCAHVSGRIDWQARMPGRHYRAPAVAGTLNLGLPGDVAEIEYRDAKASFVHFELPLALFAQALDDTPARPQALEFIDPQNRPDPVVDRLAREAVAAMGAGLCSRLRIESLGLALAARLIEHWSNLGPHEARARDALLSRHWPATDWRIQRTLQHIEAELLSDLSLADLAREVGVSTSQYQRIFRAAMHTSPWAWILQRRVERAAVLLATTRRPVTAIAAELRFSTSQQFATVFRRVMGLTPSAYRRGLGATG